MTATCFFCDCDLCKHIQLLHGIRKDSPPFPPSQETDIQTDDEKTPPCSQDDAPFETEELD